jgi:hypothetical protein
MLTARTRKNATKAAIDKAVHEGLVVVSGYAPATIASFNRLLRHVRRRSTLLDPRGTPSQSDLDGYNIVVTGLLSLASFDWLRPVEDWESAGRNLRPQFASLARHLMASYPVPNFMTSVWFEDRSGTTWRRQGWYRHIGSGQNIRTADLPLPYTKKMAHEFLQAPDHFTVEAALRWGQVRGLGGPKELAIAIASTRLGRSFEFEDFWATVVHFFVNHPELDLTQVGPVVDYLHNQRFVSEEVFLEDGLRVELDPPQPNLSMKGRTPRSLLRQVGEWHAKLKRPRKSPLLTWRSSGIGEFHHVERDAPEGFRCWTIRELTSSEELRREGEAMRHCVAGYAGDCARSETSIWSMRFENDERRFRVMTIEIDLATRTICQCRRRNNASANEKSIDVMKLWAGREGLKLGFWKVGVLVVA